MADSTALPLLPAAPLLAEHMMPRALSRAPAAPTTPGRHMMPRARSRIVGAGGAAPVLVLHAVLAGYQTSAPVGWRSWDTTGPFDETSAPGGGTFQAGTLRVLATYRV